jgi:hypothetical protein
MKSLTSRFKLAKSALGLAISAATVMGVAVVPAHAASRIENLSTSWPRIVHTAVVGQGSGGGSITLSTSRSVSHTISGSIGISVSIVEASIGYSYAESETVTYSYTTAAPLSSRCYKITAYDDFRRDSFKWIKDVSGWFDSSGNAITRDHRQVYYETGNYAKPAWGC